MSSNTNLGIGFHNFSLVSFLDLAESINFEYFNLRLYFALYLSNLSNDSDDYRIPPLSLLSQIHKRATKMKEIRFFIMKHILTQ